MPGSDLNLTHRLHRRPGCDQEDPRVPEGQSQNHSVHPRARKPGAAVRLFRLITKPRPRPQCPLAAHKLRGGDRPGHRAKMGLSAEQTRADAGDVSGIQGEFCSKMATRRALIDGELPLDPRKKGVYSSYTLSKSESIR